MDGYREMTAEPLNNEALNNESHHGGFTDCSCPTAQCFIEIDRENPPTGHSVLVLMSANWFEMVPNCASMCSVPSRLHPGRQLLQSPLVFANEVSLWDNWFPFCTGTTFLKDWGDLEQLVHIQLSVFGWKLDMIVYSYLRDRP